jgi:adenylate cyclase
LGRARGRVRFFFPAAPLTDHSSRFGGWFHEARRRRLFVPIVAYLAVAVTIIELSGAIFEALLLPDWGARLVTVLLILGFPVVVVLAWVFDLTPQGVRKTESQVEQPAEVPRAGDVAKSPLSPPRVRRVTSSRPSFAGPTVPVGGRLPVGSASAPVEDAPPAAPPDPERVKRAALGHLRHELKTPINGILGYSEMLLEDLAEDGDTDEEIRGDLEKIRVAGRRLLSLIDEILSPGQIGEEGRDLEDYGARIRADLRNPVNAVVGYAELLKETSRETGREHLLPDLDRIETSARRLLELSTDIVQVATAHTDGLLADGRLHQASAITEGVLSKVRSRASSVSDEGMGSLLVVDDNATNRDLLSRQLARAGYLVQTAEGGRQAMELLATRPFDLVLLDVIMPEMDGLDVLRAVKSDPGLASVPVIMLSSLDDVESAIRCVEMGAEDFLSKPFHPTLLQARIGATLEVRHLRDRELGHQARLDEAERLTTKLLRGTFPDALARRVRAGESGIVESYGEAAVLWCDLDRAARTHARDPGQVAGRMQRILETVDEVAREHELDALAASGDGVVVAAGVPVPVADHTDRVAAAALELRSRLTADPAFDAPVRVGIDSGEVTGGVLGGERLGYHLWGETVDLARMLGESAAPGEVRVSPGAFRLLRDRWTCASLGVQETPGRGQMRTYRLEGPA